MRGLDEVVNQFSGCFTRLNKILFYNDKVIRLIDKAENMWKITFTINKEFKGVMVTPGVNEFFIPAKSPKNSYLRG